MAALTDWSCEFGGLTLGVPDSPVSLVAVDGLLSLPDVRTSDLTLVQRHGLWPGDDYLSGRTVTLTLEVYGRDDAEFSDALTAVAAAFAPGLPESPLRFRFPAVASGHTAYTMARPRKRSAPLDLNAAYRVANVVVELYATDPYIYGDEAQSVTAPAGAGGSPVVRLRQRGSVPARPVITVTGAESPRLENFTTGRYFAVNHAGTVTVDSAQERVTADDGTNLTDMVDPGSDWPEYPHGDHFLRLTHTGPAEAAAEITWRDAWL